MIICKTLDQLSPSLSKAEILKYGGEEADQAAIPL